MKFLYYILPLLLTGLFACKSNKKFDSEKIGKLEADFNTSPTDTTYDKLITAYLEIMQEHKDEPALVEDLLAKCSAASIKMNNCRQTVIFLNNLIKNKRIHQVIFTSHSNTLAKTASIPLYEVELSSGGISEVKFHKVADESFYEINPTISKEINSGVREHGVMGPEWE